LALESIVSVPDSTVLVLESAVSVPDSAVLILGSIALVPERVAVRVDGVSLRSKTWLSEGAMLRQECAGLAAGVEALTARMDRSSLTVIAAGIEELRLRHPNSHDASFVRSQPKELCIPRRGFSRR
jgi:hypothetical protein